MELIDIIRQAQGGHAIDNLARTFNISPEQANAAIAATLPELAFRIERNTLSRGGLADLVEALGHGHHEDILESPQVLADPRMQTEGNAILSNIMGNRDASRALASRAAATSGLSESLIKLLLPIIANWLMGSLAKQSKGGLGDIIAKLPDILGGKGVPRPGTGGMPQAAPPRPVGGSTGQAPGMGRGFELPQSAPIGGGNPMPWPSGMGQTAGGAPAPAGTSSGFPMPRPLGDAGGGDDPWSRRTAPVTRPQASSPQIKPQSPLPMPGATVPGVPGTAENPYGDLSDIIRGGKGAPSGGGILWSIVRNMLGGSLGFGGKSGVMSWLFKLIIMRFGWTILRRLLGTR